MRVSDPTIAFIVMSGCAAVVFTVKAIVSGVLRYQENELKAQSPQVARGTFESDARLDRIQNALDTMAVEVERISENQRFATKLLTDRSESAAPAAAENVAPRRKAPRPST